MAEKTTDYQLDTPPPRLQKVWGSSRTEEIIAPEETMTNKERLIKAYNDGDIEAMKDNLSIVIEEMIDETIDSLSVEPSEEEELRAALRAGQECWVVDTGNTDLPDDVYVGNREEITDMLLKRYNLDDVPFCWEFEKVMIR